MQYTEHYELPQFESGDKPTWLQDVNGALSKIDVGMNASKVASDSAVAVSNGASETATSAASTAQTASEAAASAVTTANAASTAAASAASVADSALVKANSAESAASAAQTAASGAQTTASNANSKATAALNALGFLPANAITSESFSDYSNRYLAIRHLFDDMSATEKKHVTAIALADNAGQYTIFRKIGWQVNDMEFSVVRGAHIMTIYVPDSIEDAPLADYMLSTSGNTTYSSTNTYTNWTTCYLFTDALI